MSKLSREEIESRVRAIVANKLFVPDEELAREEASFTDDLGADSLDMVELVMGYEREFGISISDEDSERFYTLKDVYEYLEKQDVL